MGNIDVLYDLYTFLMGEETHASTAKIMFYSDFTVN